METSSFKLSGKDPRAVSIARRAPNGQRGLPRYIGREYLDLAPSEALLKAWNVKHRKISLAEYTQRFYQETLSHRSPSQVFQDLGEVAILLCYEAPGEFCHRRLVAQWLEEALGISIPEKGFGELRRPY